MQIFGEASLRDYLDKRIASMNHEIEAEPANRLLNTNEAQYVEYLVEAYAIEPLVFSWDGMHLTDSEELIPADACPNLFPLGLDRAT